MLKTTQDSWSYTGTVVADKYSNATVSVGENVTWNGTINNNNSAASSHNEIYDLNGRRLFSIPAKGIYIQNGKKYICNVR